MFYFNSGDVVIRMKSSVAGLQRGLSYIVERIDQNGNLMLRGVKGFHNANEFKLYRKAIK